MSDAPDAAPLTEEETLGEPSGYALFKNSHNGRPDAPESEVIAAVKRGRP